MQQRNRSQPLSRRRIAVAALAALLPVTDALAAFWVDNEPQNLVAQPRFESGAISLRLPAVSPFPLVAGGWGARGGGDGITVVPRSAFDGERSLQIHSTPTTTAHLLQDIPLATRSFRLQLAVQRLRGRQSLRLLQGWDRMDPDSAEPGIRVEFSAAAVRVTTRAGSWSFATPLRPGAWIQIALTADARTDQIHLELDGRLVASLPGVPALPPQTLVLGGNGARAPSRYRYDGFSLYRLAELELAELRRESLRWVQTGDLPYVTSRLDAAALALSRGAETMAAPELRAALRLLQRAGGDADEVARLSAAVGALTRLVEAS